MYNPSGRPGNERPARAQAFAISAVTLPFGWFAASIASLAISEVLRVVVPALVETLMNR